MNQKLTGVLWHKQSINEPSMSEVLIEAGRNNGTFPLVQHGCNSLSINVLAPAISALEVVRGLIQHGRQLGQHCSVSHLHHWVQGAGQDRSSPVWFCVCAEMLAQQTAPQKMPQLIDRRALGLSPVPWTTSVFLAEKVCSMLPVKSSSLLRWTLW